MTVAKHTHVLGVFIQDVLLAGDGDPRILGVTESTLVLWTTPKHPRYKDQLWLVRRTRPNTSNANLEE